MQRAIMFTASNGSQIIDFRPDADIRREEEIYMFQRREREEYYKKIEEADSIKGRIKSFVRRIFAWNQTDIIHGVLIWDLCQVYANISSLKAKLNTEII